MHNVKQEMGSLMNPTSYEVRIATFSNDEVN